MVVTATKHVADKCSSTAFWRTTCNCPQLRSFFCWNKRRWLYCTSRLDIKRVNILSTSQSLYEWKTVNLSFLWKLLDRKVCSLLASWVRNLLEAPKTEIAGKGGTSGGQVFLLFVSDRKPRVRAGIPEAFSRPWPSLRMLAPQRSGGNHFLKDELIRNA